MNQLHKLSDVIYTYICYHCKKKLEWTYHPDADGSYYNAVCCGIKSTFHPTHGVLDTEPYGDEPK